MKDRFRRIYHAMTKRLTQTYSGGAYQAIEVKTLIIPVIFDQMFLVGISFLNTAMISSSGEAAISAVNSGESLHWFLIGIFNSVALGGTVLIAQYSGQRNKTMIGRMANSTVHAAVLASLIISLVILCFKDMILSLLFGGAEADVLANTGIYMIGLMISYPFWAFMEGVNASMRGIGRSKPTLRLTIVTNSLYIVGNFLTIVILHLGIVGLVISMFVSHVVGAIYAYYTYRNHRYDLNIEKSVFSLPSWQHVSRIVTVSIPLMLEQLFFNGGKIVTQTFIVGFGTAQLAGHAILSIWMRLGEILPTALQISIVPLVGKSIGQRNIQDARRITWTFIFTGMCCFVLAHLILFPLFPVVLPLFSPPESVVSLLMEVYLMALPHYILTWGISFILPAALRAAGDAKVTSIISLSTMWSFRIGLGYILGVTLNMGIKGIWLAMCLEWGLRGAIFIWRFREDKWYHFDMIEN